jgi:hypothetical protein
MARPPVSASRPPAAFVVGAARSGTTLVRLMLDAHPQLAIPAETHFVPRLAVLWERSADPAGEFVAQVVRQERWVDLALPADRLAQAIAEARPAVLGDALRILYGLYAEVRDKSRWGDKTPAYVLHMPLIAAHIPEARFVHVIRDGRAVALSHRGLWFGPQTIEEAARLWDTRVRQARRDAARLPADSYVEIRYEDLVASPAEQLRHVCELVELPWDDAMLDYHVHAGERLAETDEGTGRLILQTEPGRESRRRLQTPPDPSRRFRWREELTTDELRRFAAIAGPLLEELGYPP